MVLADAHGQGLADAALLLALGVALLGLAGLLLLAAPVAGTELGRKVGGSGAGMAAGLILGFGIELIVMISFWNGFPQHKGPYFLALALGFLAGALPGLWLHARRE